MYVKRDYTKFIKYIINKKKRTNEIRVTKMYVKRDHTEFIKSIINKKKGQRKSD